MSRLRLIGSVVPGIGLGALPVVAAVVLAAGAAGVLEGTGVVRVPSSETDAPLVVGDRPATAEALVASGTTDASVALPEPGGAPAATPGADGTAPAQDAPSSTTTTAPTPSEPTPLRSVPAAPPSTATPPTVPGPGTAPTPPVPARVAVPNAGNGLRDATDDVADVTSALTEGLAEALGGKDSAVGGLVHGLGGTVDDTVRGLGDGLGGVLGAQ